MKLIKVLDTEIINGNYIKFALFFCDLCKQEVRRRKGAGPKQKTCGCKWHHGGYHTRLHTVWIGMKARCSNPKEQNYDRYGGRGISFCKEWEYFIDFRKWAMSSGYSDDLYIDRIDNDGNYEPSNCRFITNAENCRNKSNNKLTHEDVREIKRIFNIGGCTKKSIAEKYNVSAVMISKIILNKTWKGVNP